MKLHSIKILCWLEKNLIIFFLKIWLNSLINSKIGLMVVFPKSSIEFFVIDFLD
jgi:hypothetical protein